VADLDFMKSLLKKIFLIFLVSFLGIFLLSWLANWQTKKLLETFYGIEAPKFEFLKNEVGYLVETKVETKEEREFISPDGKLKFRYPADWKEMRIQGLEKMFLPQEVGEMINPLFFAKKTEKRELTFAFLAVKELILEEEITPEKIIEKIEEHHQQRRGIKILKLEQKNGKITFEGTQTKFLEYELFQKGKLLPTEEKKIYLVIFTVFGRRLPNLQEEIEQTLDSIELLE